MTIVTVDLTHPPGPYRGPGKGDDARAGMDELNHRFLYFVDIDDGRGKGPTYAMTARPGSNSQPTSSPTSAPENAPRSAAVPYVMRPVTSSTQRRSRPTIEVRSTGKPWPDR